MTTARPTTHEIIAAIAEKHLGLATLATRNSDALDFSDQAVWQIKAALEAAFAAGAAEAAAAITTGSEQTA